MKRLVNSIRHLPRWPSFWRQYYALKHPDLRCAEIMVELRGGLMALVPATLMSAFDEVFLREVYGSVPPATLGRDPVVIDVGANAGFFSLYLLSHRPDARVIAFEPHPAHLALLTRQMQLNPGLRVTVDARAVYREAKTLHLHFDGREPYSVGASLFPAPDADASVAVEATTLAAIFEAYEIEKCDLLKLDCEGAEYDILHQCPDSIFKSTDNIVLEVHERAGEPRRVDELVRLLRGKDYRVRNRKDEIVTCRR